ncbi:MAG: hypothetical protein C6P37_16500 [Caldibacillus debilis]|uniref:tetrahydrofolate synthase n=1 Tax=Caldibacillus debilis TaxID=301148 RepID=A0A3E0JUU3_9BACI|nr:Mur ligase family protein [Caldibacillus debilis]REJ23853.1 MAG: hypothetical protein C6P37_16500 [Caldibacillus debilis]
MNGIHTRKEAEDLIYRSYLRAVGNIKEKRDAEVRKPELTRKLFRLLGSPDRGQKFILVAGSKGKGSTARLISSLLSHLGWKVGLFTSPHLVAFNERIRIDGKAIPDGDFIRLANEILGPFTEIESGLRDDEYQGPIGLALAVACLWFKEKNTDINVIECGRGGKFDDVNILDNEWAVITPVMEEHMTHLGPTMDDVVSHKLGIIKPITKFVYVSGQGETLPKIKARMDDLAPAHVFYYGEDFFAENISPGETGTCFDVRTPRAFYPRLRLSLLGAFQAVNAAVAVKVCEDVYGGAIPYQTADRCFAAIQWPGRCELIDRNPAVIVDGAINEKSAAYVKEVIESMGRKNVVSIVGVPTDKDYKGVIRVLSGFSKKLLITSPDISYLTFPADALAYARSLTDRAAEIHPLEAAVKAAMREGDVDAILIVGTQSLIANAKRLWNQNLMDIGK